MKFYKKYKKKKRYKVRTCDPRIAGLTFNPLSYADSYLLKYK